MTFGINQLSQGFSGAGALNQSAAGQLMKALETGYDIGGNVTGGAALRPQSLESSLKVVTHRADHIKFWKKIPKSAAYSTVEEYNQLTDYGGQATPFIQEGELPQASDSSYIRRTQLVKFLGTVREVTHQASVVHPAHGNLIALENQNGILYLLRQIEQMMFEGDSSLAFSGESAEWDGLNALIDSTSVVDLEGTALQQSDIQDASNTIIENYGYPTDLFLNTKTMNDLVRMQNPAQRNQHPYPTNGQLGQTFNSIATMGGDIAFNPNIFVRRTPKAPTAATSLNAPATPASAVAVVNAAGTTGNHNKGTDSADTSFTYVVTAANRFGESAPTAIPGAVTTMTSAQKTANNTVDVTITNPGVIGAFLPEFFKVYRTKARTSVTVSTDLNDYQLVAQLPAASQAAGGVTTFSDVNLTLPGTTTAYMGQMTPDVLTFRQLMPMMKMDLAVNSPSYRWMILLYGTPVMFAPKKWIRLINVGDLDA